MRIRQTAFLFGCMLLFFTACGSAADSADTSSDVPTIPASMIEATEKIETADLPAEADSSTEIEVVSETETQTEAGPGSASQADEELKAQAQEKYQELIDTYQSLYTARSREDAYTAAKMNSLTASYYPEDNTDRNPEVGYALIDLEGNGVYNLIIGVNEDSLKGTLILDLYTMSGSDIVHLCSSTKNDKYYAGAGGRIYLEGSSGGMDKHFLQYDIEDSYLAVYSEFAYDGSLQADSHWYIVEGDSSLSISEEEAEEKITSFREDFQIFELNSFTDTAET